MLLTIATIWRSGRELLRAWRTRFDIGVQARDGIVERRFNQVDWNTRCQSEPGIVLDLTAEIADLSSADVPAE